METTTMGRVVVDAVVENVHDLWDQERGRLPADQVRRVVVADALVDTGSTTLALPTRLITQLGLKKTRERSALAATGVRTVNIFDVVKLNVQGRECRVEVTEVSDEVPVLIGQVPLEMMDFVVDPQARKLIGNPAHGGIETLELL